MLNGPPVLPNTILPHPKASPKSVNRIPTWLFLGQFTNDVKLQILTDRFTLNRTEQVFLVRHLMQGRSDRVDKALLRKLLMSSGVCPHFTGIPFELAMHYLELEFRNRGSVIVRPGDFYDKVFLLLEGACEVVSSLGEILVNEDGVFGQKELYRTIKSQVAVRCKSDCWFLVIKKIDYFSALRKYRLIETKQLEDFLMKAPVIRTLGEQLLKKLCPLFSKIEVVQKQYLIRQDQTSNHIALVIEGQLKAMYINAFNQESPILSFGPYQILCLQSILLLPSPFDIVCQSKTSTIYKISTQRFVKILQSYSSNDCPFWRDLKQFAQQKLQTHSDIVDRHNARIGFLKLARSKNNNKNIKSRSTQIHTQPGQDTKLKTKYFRKDLMKIRFHSTSTTRSSWTIRSKKDQPRHILNIFEGETSSAQALTQPISPMMAAYKQKLKPSNIQLDLIEQLYHKTRKMRGQMSASVYKPFRRSKQQETELLMKRIQLSSCKKRRNKNICLFDPQRIVDFAETVSFSQQLSP